MSHFPLMQPSIEFHVNLLRQLPGMFLVMDQDSRFMYSNTYTANIFGFRDEESMLGINAHGIRCPAGECAEQFFTQDRIVTNTDSELTILDIHTYAQDDPKIFITIKKPFKHKGNTIGLICHATEIYSKTLSQTCSALIKADQKYLPDRSKIEKSYTIGNNFLPNNKLSKRETECVFYLLRGKTAKEIARAMNISHRTAEAHIDRIKKKFNCHNKSQIVEYALEAGYLNYIPEHVMSSLNITHVLHQAKKI